MGSFFCFRTLVLSALISGYHRGVRAALNTLLEDVVDALVSSTIYSTNLIPQLCDVRHGLLKSHCADDGHLSPAPYLLIERRGGQLGSVRVKIRRIELERVDWGSERETWMDAYDDVIKKGMQWRGNSTGDTDSWTPTLQDIALNGKATVDVNTALGNWRDVDVEVTLLIREASFVLTKKDGVHNMVGDMEDMFAAVHIEPDSCTLNTKLTLGAADLMTKTVLRLLTPWFESQLAHEVASMACTVLLTLRETMNADAPAAERNTLTIKKKTAKHDWLLHWLEELNVDLLPLLCPTNSLAAAQDSLCTPGGHMFITHALIKKVSRSVSHVSTKMLLHLTRYVRLRRMRLFDVTFAPINSTDRDGKWLSATQYSAYGLRYLAKNRDAHAKIWLWREFTKLRREKKGVPRKIAKKYEVAVSLLNPSRPVHIQCNLAYKPSFFRHARYI
eukprot:GEMP01050874.1.p1 GENE.GEMP01050874.1~~GEMP01050874.1.p1  ORF type:complete len:445 (+),score=89.47 GEMP01050874.1:119-1453(+)